MEKVHTLGNHQTYIAKSFQVAYFLHSLSFSWDAKQSRVILLSPCENFRILKRGTVIHTCIFLFMGIGIIYSKRQSMFQIIILAHEMLMLSACFTLMQAFNKHASEVCQYINGHLSYPRPQGCLNFQQRNTSVTCAFCMLYAYALFPLLFLVSFVCVYGLHAYNPCKATLLGYWLLPECHSQSFNLFVNFAVKFVVLLTNHWIWSYAFSAITVEIGVIILLGTLTFLDNLKR